MLYFLERLPFLIRFLCSLYASCSHANTCARDPEKCRYVCLAPFCGR
ncbi:MAG: hypothetical protein IJ934_02555 [Acetobacter sp.]|nr:hypothetical protein [Acetobacter sp.]